MRLIPLLLALFLAPMSALAEGLMIKDPYLRVSGPMARSAAAFMVIENHSDKDMRLIAARSDAARKLELHTHIMDGDIAKMREIEGGILIEAGGTHLMKRGGDHVMFMGLTGKLAEGDTVALTLIFEGGVEIALSLPVDNARKDTHTDHSGH